MLHKDSTFVSPLVLLCLLLGFGWILPEEPSVRQLPWSTD